MQVYKPDDYTISIGVPVAAINLLGLDFPVSVEVSDWVSITANKPVQRFQHSSGIHGEPFVEMTRNTSRVFNLTILQASADVKLLRALFQLQTLGEIGFPFSIFEGGLLPVGLQGVDAFKQKSVYPVAYIVDEPQESWSLVGSTWVYQIQTLAGGTIYA